MKLKPIFGLICILALMLASCQAPTAAPTQVQMANPASQNCIAQGGTLQIEKRGDEGEFGVCYFEDNLQCEEWALLYGDCPVGGVKVTGYATPAARYCAITGGTYAITGNTGADDEQGSCTFKNGSVCDAWDYYNGKCEPDYAPPEEQQIFTNEEAGYSLQAPSDWSEATLPDQNDGAIHGMGYSGPEGGVEVYWGVGFGGACPEGTEPVRLAQGEVQACHTTKDDGTETWEQIGYQVSGGNSFSVRAYTSSAEQSSHDTVLLVLSTLSFMTPAATGMTIQPLSMEVCDGQAQAMSHALGDLVPTQSEEPLDDFVNNASGTGCQATITGNGTQFESPSAVAETLEAMLEEQGWTADLMLVADGPTGTFKGYRKGNQICWAGAMWTPDESANCPKDQPITTCQLTPEQQIYSVTLNCGVEVSAGETAASTEGSPEVGGGAGQLVFDSTRGGVGYRDLYVMNSDGYDMSRLTRGEANSFAGPWSPDGQRIVYTSYDGGVTETYIAVINPDGSGKTIISQINGSDEGFPDWSPDGAKIAFTSRRDGNNEIYVMNADGSNPVRLTNSPTDDFAPSWSPDGARIAFVSDRDQATGVNDLFIMNADGSGVMHLTNDTALDYSPDWSPDGKMIVFRSDQDGESDIYVINVDGSGRTNLTANPGYDWAPQWSPDGKYIAFQSNRDGNFEIYLMMADGTNPVNLTNDPGDDQYPYWRP